VLIVSFCPGQGRLWPDCRVGWAGLPRGPGFLGWSGRETFDLFAERERAVLALTEAVTRIGDASVPDTVWTDVSRLLDEHEVVVLLMAIATINVWNRLAVSTHQLLPGIDET